MSSRVAETYEEHVHPDLRRLQKRAVDFWSASIAGRTKTIDDFYRFVRECPEYAESKHRDYVKYFDDICCNSGEIPTSMPIDEFKSKFLSNRQDFATRADIVRFAKATFPVQIAEMRIAKAFYAATNRSIAASDLSDMYARWTVDVGPELNAYYRGSLDHGKEKEEQQGVGDNNKIKSSYDSTFVDAFEKAFGRHMYVHEYFRYKNIEAQTNVVPDVAEIRREHSERYARLDGMHTRYLGESLDEYEFVKRFIDSSDKGPAFYQETEDDIIGGAEYRRVVSRKLSDIHRGMYDLEIEEREHGFLFARVRKDRCELDEEVLVRYVVDFKSERDVIVERVERVYDRILERRPDPLEVDDAIIEYRKKMLAGDDDEEEGYASADAELEARICSELEYHEVIKRAVRQSDPDVLPSVLFKILKAVLECRLTNHTATMAKVKFHVTQKY